MCRRTTRGFLLGISELRLRASSNRVVSGDFEDDFTHPKKAAVTVREISIDSVLKSINALLEKDRCLLSGNDRYTTCQVFFWPRGQIPSVLLKFRRAMHSFVKSAELSTPHHPLPHQSAGKIRSRMKMKMAFQGK